MLDDRLKQSLLKTHEALLQQGTLLSDERLAKCFSLFRTRFGPEVIKKLDGEGLLNLIVPYKLHLESYPVAMHQHGGAHVAAYQPVLRLVAR
jgi:hypothetical protein